MRWRWTVLVVLVRVLVCCPELAWYLLPRTWRGPWRSPWES